ncbi:unnamed protein product [Haemonchus placei]|uniref:Histidine kinase n=1 Tax=Haemonchus placei TaxID=6290 RepID=A0A0N4X888_HAEPC|nr:unnamed protein product [Haemonchus placei]
MKEFLKEKQTCHEVSARLISHIIIPYYILIMCTLLFVILRKESNRVSSFQAAIAEKQNEKEQQADTYFRSLRHQWGT